MLSLLDISLCPLTVLLEMILCSPKPVSLKFLWCGTPWRKTLPASVDSTSLSLLLLKSCVLGTQVLVDFIFFPALWRFFSLSANSHVCSWEVGHRRKGCSPGDDGPPGLQRRPFLVLLRSATVTRLMSLCFCVFSSGVLTSGTWRCPSAGGVGHSALLDSLLPADSLLTGLLKFLQNPHVP